MVNEHARKNSSTLTLAADGTLSLDDGFKARLAELGVDASSFLVNVNELLKPQIPSPVPVNNHSARLAALGEMASGMAHEINNPLSVILARASLLEMKLEGSPLLDSVKKIQANAVRISKITRGLRYFSREGEADPTADFKLNEILEDSIAIAVERAKANGIRIYTQLESDFIVHGRGYQISQIVINLLNNASDAIAELPLPEIHLSTHFENGRVLIRVRDTGAGVSPEIEKKIMTPFFTTKVAGKGTGLGLSISLGLAVEHAGTLTLNRTISASCFELNLPAYPVGMEACERKSA